MYACTYMNIILIKWLYQASICFNILADRRTVHFRSESGQIDITYFDSSFNSSPPKILKETCVYYRKKPSFWKKRIGGIGHYEENR